MVQIFVWFVVCSFLILGSLKGYNATVLAYGQVCHTYMIFDRKM